MIERAIIIGPSNPTIINLIKTQIPVPILQVDDVLTEMNGGTYPHDEDFKSMVLTPQLVDHVLSQEQIRFYVVDNFLSPDDLERASSEGFSLIKLDPQEDELVHHQIDTDQPIDQVVTDLKRILGV